MDGIIPADNQETFIINQEVHWRVMVCPVCDAAHFRNYQQLLCHLVWPPNCFNDDNKRNQTPEDDQIGPVLVPVAFPLNLVPIVLWSVLWVLYQICYYLVATPLKFVYNILASVFLSIRNFFTVLTIRALQAVPAGGFRVYITNAANACVQFIQNIPEWLYQQAAALCAIVADFFVKMYQRLKDLVANALNALGRSILKGLSAAYHYCLVVPCTSISGAIVFAMVYIDDCLEAILQYIVNAVTPLFQAVHQAYQRNIRIPIVRLYVNYVEPWIDSVCHMIAVTERDFQQARHFIFVRLPNAIDRFTGSERAWAQRAFTAVENFLEKIYRGLEWLNSFMYTFVYFPLDMRAGTSSWKRFVYYIFHIIHAIALIYMCLCSYIQLAAYLMSNDILDRLSLLQMQMHA